MPRMHSVIASSHTANMAKKKQKASWQADSTGSAGPGKTQMPPPSSLPSDGKSEKREIEIEKKKERACLQLDICKMNLLVT